MNAAPLAVPRTKTESVADAPIESTVRVHLHRDRIVWRLICAIAAVIGTGYALVDQGVHYGTAEHFDLAKMLLVHTGMTDQAVMDTATAAVNMQRAVYGQWQMWGIAITAIALLVSIFAFFRELAWLQMPDAALVLSPKGLTINSDASRRALTVVPWSAIHAVYAKYFKSRPAVAIQVSDADRYFAEPRGIQRFNPRFDAARIGIETRSLSLSNAEVLQLLNRYFTAYGKPTSKE